MLYSLKRLEKVLPYTIDINKVWVFKNYYELLQLHRTNPNYNKFMKIALQKNPDCAAMIEFSILYFGINFLLDDLLNDDTTPGADSVPAWWLEPEYITYDTLEFTMQMIKALPVLIKEGGYQEGIIYFYIDSSAVTMVAEILQHMSITQFNMLTDLIAYEDFVYEDPKELRIFVNYLLTSYLYTRRCCISFMHPITKPIQSLISIFNSANWLEREASEMFGLNFAGHCTRRRLLTDYGYKWHPLLKGFPTSGYTQLIYSDAHNQIIEEAVGLTQEMYKDPDYFKRPWTIPVVFEWITEELYYANDDSEDDEEKPEDPLNANVPEGIWERFGFQPHPLCDYPFTKEIARSEGYHDEIDEFDQEYHDSLDNFDLIDERSGQTFNYFEDLIPMREVPYMALAVADIELAWARWVGWSYNFNEDLAKDNLMMRRHFEIFPNIGYIY